MGGDVYSLPPAEFERVVRRAVEVGVPGGGFVLCPTTVANYLTLVRVGAEYRYAQ